MKPVLIGLYLLLPFWSLAQREIEYTGYETDTHDKGYIGGLFGASIPLGDYASRDFSSDAAGFAKTGLNIQIPAAYRIGDNFGLAASFYIHYHPVDGQALIEGFASFALPGSRLSYGIGNWSAVGMFAGGFGSWQLNDYINFEVTPMIGFLNVTSPGSTLTVASPASTVSAIQRSADAPAFATNVAAGFRFHGESRIGFIVMAGWTYARPQFKEVPVDYSNGANTTTTFHQAVSVLNVQGGLVFRFNRR